MKEKMVSVLVQLSFPNPTYNWTLSMFMLMMSQRCTILTMELYIN